ncbi:hypothetical protein GYH30_042158 [Glycine max]|uniref:Uncharacterized protein n=1 Tax=Glycine max TaxID=3847 RepID=A0A0R0G9N3_SOYBN|nr:hypothetical protein JHK86_042174 [Glycine max]KAH1146848.1 hypothetical protein GYH30_042158 [Glycine max]
MHFIELPKPCFVEIPYLRHGQKKNLSKEIYTKKITPENKKGSCKLGHIDFTRTPETDRAHTFHKSLQDLSELF